ncbi:MAG: hypothetical protein HZB27_05875 [Meiothermus silvanus]|nr:hypothetical protein [Allomeiothermus silvanus]
MRSYWAVSLLVALAACAPSATTPSTVQARIDTPVSFYPSEVGLEWTYQPQGARSNEPPYKLSALGTGSFAGEAALRFRFSGRGQDRIYYRRIGPDGVQLLGFEENITQTRVRFNPPMQEYPPQGNLKVGATWGGKTRFVTTLTVQNNARIAEDSLEYSYTAAGESEFSTAAGKFRGYRINLDLKDSAGQVERYEIWFVPNVGEVRTREGLLLVERNFK